MYLRIFQRYCDVDCSSENAEKKKSSKKMVCGSDGQFYSSKCEMNKKHCG